MKLSIAVLALINSTEARHYLGRRSDEATLQIGVRFADGILEDELEPDQYQIQPDVGVRFVQEGSDPIHGSAGYKKADVADLTPAQQFERKQRDTPAPVFVDDEEQVTATLDSIKTAEELVGSALPAYQDPAEFKKTHAVSETEYHLADSDEETEDTVETRRSVQWAENELKLHWFINAGEKREFQYKASIGEIRPEVLEFRDSSDANPLESADSIASKESQKKSALVKGQADKAEADADAKAHTKDELLEKKAEEEDNAARKAASDAMEKTDEVASKAAQVKKEGKPAEGSGDDGSAKAAADKKGEAPFCPPELAGMC